MQIKPLQQEIIPNLLAQVYFHTYNYSKQRLQMCFYLTQYIWVQMNAQCVNKWNKNEFKTQWML